MVPNRSEAEDILQETNLILCQKANEYDPSGHFQGWAFKIARFQVMKHMTKVKRSKLNLAMNLLKKLLPKNLILEKCRQHKKLWRFVTNFCLNLCN